MSDPVFEAFDCCAQIVRSYGPPLEQRHRDGLVAAIKLYRDLYVRDTAAVPEAENATLTAEVEYFRKQLLRCSDDNVALSRLRNVAEAENARLTRERDEVQEAHLRLCEGLGIQASVAAYLEAPRFRAAEAENDMLKDEVAELETLMADLRSANEANHRLLDRREAEITTLKAEIERGDTSPPPVPAEEGWATRLYEFLLSEFAAAPDTGQSVTADVRPHFEALCAFIAAAPAVPGWQIGDHVEKFTGDYSWGGIVCSVARLPDEHGVIMPDAPIRYLVAHKAPRGWVLHVYGHSNLRRPTPPAPAQGETDA